MKSYRLYHILVFAGLICCVTSCVKEKFGERDYPIVETGEATEISSSGAMLNGKVIYNEGGEIIEHGFLWGANQGFATNTYDNLSLGAFDKTGSFSGMAKRGMEAGQTIYYKTYVKTNDYTVYGAPSSFTSQGCSPPVISSYSPTEGYFGDTLSISGENLSYSTEISFGPKPATIVSASETEIKVIIPLITNSVSNVITLTTGGETYNLSPEFTFRTAEIDSYSPSSGLIGDLITITGSGFTSGSYYFLNHVFFGDIEANIISYTSTELIVGVPSAISSTNPSIRVTAPLFDETFDDNFTLLAPEITSISLNSGTAGSTLNIAGRGFNTFYDNNEVTLGGSPVTITSASTNIIYIRIPVDFPLPTGDYEFVVSMLGLDSNSSQSFHYDEPTK